MMSRFLFATVPVPAHSRNPLPVAARLVERGHEVLWFASRRFHGAIAAVGATPLPFVATRDYDGERLLEEFPELARLRGPRAIGWAYAELFVGEAAHRVADLEPVLAAQRVDAVLTDGLSYGVGLLAQARGIPAATFGDGPLARAHGETPAFGPGLLPMRGPLSRLRNHAVREASRRWVFARAQERHDAVRDALGLPPDGRDVLESAVSPMLHLQACTPSFEYPVPGLPATVHWVGALRPDPPEQWAPPSWWGEVCTSARPVVHVTQGSIRPDMRELVVPTLRALADEDVLVVATTGGVSAERVEALLGAPLPRNARIADFVPYDLLLPHVDLCVTNGGYTGVTTALHHGVPLVQAGSTEEKAEIGARVQWTGVGVRIRSTTPGPRRLRSAVRRALHDPGHREAAQRVGAEMRRHDAAEESADLLERLADTGDPVTEPVRPAHAR
ncbi:MAG TPA: nucleotide disphospho-sugar-binding domain-containing protein [Ornithinibacter sp.]|nr:nucleotide disphospho-sugar-binding domain-containing protein [Ornithinibacter sp.]